MNMETFTHPGSILRLELKERGMSQKNFATKIGIQPSHLSEVIKGKRSLTAQLAGKIEEALGIPAEHWIRLQAEYDYKLKAANLKNKEEIEATLLLDEYNKIYDIKAIFDFIGIALKSAVEKLRFILDVLNFGTPAIERQTVIGYFHRSEKTGLDTRMIATWSVIAKYEANQKPAPEKSFDKKRMDNLAEDLRLIFHENSNTINRVERALYEYGIKFCIVPKVKHASIDGFSFFAGGAPAIVITKRYNRIDNIAFAVMHEVGHLKLHTADNNEGRINMQRTGCESIPKEEKEANEFAANALIPKQLWDSLPPMPLTPLGIQSKCAKWAKENRINKWIALGRISHETGMYMFKSDSTRELN